VFDDRGLAASKHGLFSQCDVVKREADRNSPNRRESRIMNSMRLARSRARMSSSEAGI
jgi:hypothetical protein